MYHAPGLPNSFFNAPILFFAVAFAVGCGGSTSSPTPTPTPTSSNGHFRALKSVTTSQSHSAASQAAGHATATMIYSRNLATSTLLPDGRVLVAGGSSDPVGTYTAEIFDPLTETFTLLDSKMSWGRYGHCAVTLPDDRVLLIGGGPMAWMNPVPWVPSTVDVFDPATNTFTAHALSPVPPDNYDNSDGATQCFLLSANRVLVITIHSGLMMRVLDTNTWQTRPLQWNAGSMPLYSSVAQTPDGKVWFVGGRFGWSAPVETTADIWWFDPETESFSTAGKLIQPRALAGILAFPDNSVEVYGGLYSEDDEGGIRSQAISSIEHIDPLGTSSRIGDLPMPKAIFTSVMLQNGKSLHVGGHAGKGDAEGSSDTQFVFDETTHVSGATGSMVVQREGYGITPLTTGRVLIAGGANGIDDTNTAEIFEPDASIYVLLPKTTLVPGEFMQLSTESATHGDVTWDVKYGTITMTGGYTAPSENPNGSADPATTVQDEVIATLSTGAKAVAPITIQFPSLTGP